MHYLQLSPHEAFVASVVLGVLVLATRPLRELRLWGGLRLIARELSIACLLLAMWSFTGDLAKRHVEGAASHGEHIWAVERAAHLPDEAVIQQTLLGHVTIIHWLNTYYLYAHLNSMAILLVWLFWRHRDRYASVRATVVLFTLVATLMQAVPVMPPRLLATLGVRDLPMMYGQSVYDAFGQGSADQLAAMPSIHVGWSILVAVVVIEVSTSRWRWLVLLHPLLTTMVVVLTGNHYWADGIVAAAVLVPALAAGPAVVAWAARRRATAHAPAVVVPEPAYATAPDRA